MKKYRKKPVVIEAVQLTKANLSDVSLLVKDSEVSFCPYELRIPTLEGTMIGGVGDWVIKGIEGEFYPCKNSVFVNSYEEVSDE